MKPSIIAFLFVLVAALINVSSGVCPHEQPNLIKYSSIQSWNVAKAKVVINSNQNVLLDVSPPLLTSIIVNGTLIFNDTTLSLNVEWIRVNPSGSLFIGSNEAGCAIKNKITITLFGDRNTSNIIGVDSENVALGYKGLVILSGASVSIVGEVKGPTWTRLTQTAYNGTTTINVEDKVQWKQGDQIVISTTDFPQSFTRTSQNVLNASVAWQYGRGTPDQNEVRTVVSVSNNGKVITIDQPLKFMHYGLNFERAEVGLINRNIVLKGDDSTNVTLFGGHLMLRKVAVGIIQGVEITRMGQRGVLGRYPLHIHLAKESWDSGYLFKDNSLHHNFQRCIVVHHSSGVTIDGNVAYDNVGHCYFLEDGSERGNTFNKNLGIKTAPMADELWGQLLPTDSQPAMFWIVNANNTFTNNAAVGARFGYWYSMPTRPTGPSANDFLANDTWVRPRIAPLGGFADNVAHSNSRNGLHIDDMEVQDTLDTELAGYYPRFPPYIGSSNGGTAEALFDNFITYKNRGYGTWARGGPLVFNNFKSFGNRLGHNSPPSPSVMQNSWIVGETDNIGNPLPAENGRSRPNPDNNSAAVIGWETYDNSGNQFVKDTVFENFTTNSNRKSGVLSALNCGPFIIQSRNYLRNLTFVNANQVYIVPCTTGDNPNGWVMFDTDGSATEFPQWIVANNELLIDEDDKCVARPEWNAYTCPPFGGRYVQLFVTAMNSTALTEPVYNGTYTTRMNNGIGHTTFTKLGTNKSFTSRGRRLSNGSPDHQTMVNLKSRNGGYMVTFLNNVPTPPNLKITWAATLPYDWMFVVVPYPQTHFPLNITLGLNTQFKNYVYQVDSLEKMTSKYFYYYDSSKELLYLRLDSTIESFGTRWGFSYIDGDDDYTFIIRSTCEGDGLGCKVSTKLTPPAPIDINVEDTFSANLQYCQSTSHNIQHNHTSGYGKFRINPLNKTVNYYLVHDQSNNAVSTVSIKEGAIGQPGTKLANFVFVTNPIQFFMKLTRRLWVKILKGSLYVNVQTVNYEDAIRGQIGCDEANCRLPPAISTIDPCTFYDDTNSISYYSEITNSTKFVSGRSVGSIPGVNTTIVLNSTEQAICGEQSLAISITNGNGYFGLTPRTYVDTSIYKFLSFYVKISSVLVNSLNVIVNNGTATIATKAVTQFIDNFYLDQEWSRVKVPLDYLNFGANQSVNWIGFSRVDAKGDVSITYYIDEIRFIKDVTEPMSVGMTSSEVYTDQPLCIEGPNSVTTSSPSSASTTSGSNNGVSTNGDSDIDSEMSTGVTFTINITILIISLLAFL